MSAFRAIDEVERGSSQCSSSCFLFLQSVLVSGGSLICTTIPCKKRRRMRRNVRNRKPSFAFRFCTNCGIASTEFRLSSFAAKCEIPKGVADRVADEIYSALYRRVIADGIVNEKERSELAWLSSALELDADRISVIEKRCREQKYDRAVETVLADGTVTPEEADELEKIRRQMGLSKSVAFQLTKENAQSAYLATFRQVVRDGTVTPEERQELLRLKQALAISDSEASGIVRAESLNLYRQSFLSVIQDGVVTPEEEETLAFLKEWCGLPNIDIEQYAVRLREVKRLSAYREGKLTFSLNVDDPRRWRDMPLALFLHIAIRDANAA